MSNIRVSIDLVDPEEMAANYRKPILRAIANTVKARARALAPRGSSHKKGTKRLATSIDKWVSMDGEEAAVYAKSRHAHLVIVGTKPHIIAKGSSSTVKKGKRGAKAARRPMRIGDQWRMGPFQHPGSRPNDFLTKAAEDSRAELPGVIEAATQKVDQAKLRKVQ